MEVALPPLLPPPPPPPMQCAHTYLLYRSGTSLLMVSGWMVVAQPLLGHSRWVTSPLPILEVRYERRQSWQWVWPQGWCWAHFDPSTDMKHTSQSKWASANSLSFSVLSWARSSDRAARGRVMSWTARGSQEGLGWAGSSYSSLSS